MDFNLITIMDNNLKIKKELLSLYQEIKNNFQNNIENISEEYINEDNPLELIRIIKELLINQKGSDIKLNKNNNLNKDINNDKILKDYIQLENQIKKLEMDIKYYLKQYLSYKIQKDSLEMKLNAYVSLEEEYEELKEKVKYEGGKFLDNDRKDNEIIILRSENSTLKKEITKVENKIKNNEIKNKEYQNKIKDLQNTVENLNKKIYKLEKIIKDNTIKNNTLNRNNNNSCTNLRIKSSENVSYRSNNNSNNNYSLANLKNIISLNNSNNTRRLLNFRSPKNDIIYLDNKNINNNTINATNTNIFSPTYNKMIKGLNNKKKIILPVKKEYIILNNHQRNNSISVLRERDNNNKTISLSKYNADKKDLYLHKSSNKIKNNNKLFNSNSKHNNLYPLSYKNPKNNGQIVRKYIQKELIRNASSKTIKGESKI